MDGFAPSGPVFESVGVPIQHAANRMLAIDVDGQYIFCNPGDLKHCMHSCKTLPPGFEQTCAAAVSDTFAPVPLCFPASQLVFTVNRGKVKMDDLAAGDVVLDATLAPTKVVGFLHKDAEIVADFLSLTTPGLASLEISADHLVFDGATFVLAGETSSLAAVALAGTLISVKTLKEVVKRKGAYAPLTASGTLIVGNFACSCYALPGRLGNFVSHGAANVALWLVRAEIVSFDFHTFEEYIHMLCELAELAE